MTDFIRKACAAHRFACRRLPTLRAAAEAADRLAWAAAYFLLLAALLVR